MAEAFMETLEVQVRQMTQHILSQLTPNLSMMSNVLIIGVRDLGVAVAKELVLNWSSLGSLTLMERDEVGTSLAERCRQELLEQHPLAVVKVEGVEGLSERRYLSKGQYTTVVLTQGLEPVDNAEDEAHVSSKWILDLCHGSRIPVIMAETRGCFARMFSDCGNNYKVAGWKATAPTKVMIVSITQEGEALVTCEDDLPHCLQAGDLVTFNKVRGMVQLNEPEQPAEVSSVLGPFTFRIRVDTTHFPKYEGGGTVAQLKSPQFLNFKPYDESIYEPQFLYSDFEMLEQSKRLHLAFHALDQVVSRRGDPLPRSWNMEDGNKLINIGMRIAKKIVKTKKFGLGSSHQSLSKLDDITSKSIRLLCYTAKGQLAPVNQAVAGMVTQEVIKIATGRYRPISQWAYFDGTELLPGIILRNVDEAGLLRDSRDKWGQAANALIYGVMSCCNTRVLVTNGAVKADIPN